MTKPPRSHEPMSPLDELLFRSERDPGKRSTMAAVYRLDATPDFAALEHAFERTSREFLRLRQRVVEPTAGFGPACWTTDPDFDLAYHLRRIRLSPGASLPDVLAWLEPELMTPLDPTRPLWTATLFEGLDDGGAALVLKLSHAVSDGLGGIALNELLFDRERAAPRRPMPPLPLPEDATPDELAAEELGRMASHALDFAAKWAGQLAGLADRFRDDPRGVFEDVARHASSALRVLDSGAPHSPLLAGRSRKRRLFWLALSLPRLKAAARAAGGSTNDVYLAGICGALARYHEGLFLPVESLPLGLPISTRRAGADVGGNHFVAAVLAAPLALRDPAARMKAIAEQVRAIRNEPGLDYAERSAPWLAALPAPLSARLLAAMRAPDVQASNVPGHRHDVFLAGCRVEQLLGIGPLPGAAMMTTLVSHCGQATLTVHYDPAALRDAPFFERCLREAFAEIELLAEDVRDATDRGPDRAGGRERTDAMIEISHAQTLAEVDHDEPGPSVGAFFDLDGTLVSGFTAASFVQNRLREGELDTAMLGETLRLGLEGLRGRLPFDEFLALSLGTLAGRPAEELERLGHALFESEIRGRLQAPIVELVFAHRDRGHQVVLASSATNFQVLPVAEALGIDDVLCNRLEVDASGRLTGRLVGPVIWAAGKARAAQAFALAHGIELEASYFYADGSEDVASMYLVGHPRPVNPGRRMRAVAMRRGWPVIRVPESARAASVRPRGSALPSQLLNAFLRSGGSR